MLTFCQTGRIFKNLTRNRPGVFCLTILLGFLAPISSAQAQTGFHLDLESQQVPWSQLSFQAKNFWVEVSTDIQMKSLRTSDLAAVLLASPKGTPIRPLTPQINEMTINTTIDPRSRSPVKIHNRIWFNPTNAAAIGRIRIRRGEDDFKKMYRFTDQGVFRHRIEPKNKKEASLEPEQWTDVKDSFYPYEQTAMACPGVTERSLLIYILSAVDIYKMNTPISLCVFDKRQLHRVQLKKLGVHPIRIDYIEKNQQSTIRKNDMIKAHKISITASPTVSDSKESENFSFLGFRRDISIFIDPISQLPIQASGIIPTVGRTDLRLRECQTIR
jgi:hypothetical protein